jgi:hypothetical protein
MMNERIKVVAVGGPNGQIQNELGSFDSLDDVLSYLKENDIRDDNGDKVDKFYDDGWLEWEFEGEKLKDYVVNEGLMVEVKA